MLHHGDSGETYGLGRQFAGLVLSSVNEILLFTNPCESGRGEVRTRVGWFTGGRISPQWCRRGGADCGGNPHPLARSVQGLQVVFNTK